MVDWSPCARRRPGFWRLPAAAVRERSNCRRDRRRRRRPVTSQLQSPDGTPAPGSPQDPALKSGFDAQGNPVATPGQKRPFILDPLLQ